MSKKFLANVVILLAANLLIKPFWIFGVDLTVQNSLGNALYGQYIHLFTLSLFFTMILDFGINNYTSSFVAKHPQLLAEHTGTIIPFKLFLSAAYILLTLFFGYLNQIKGEHLLMLLALTINQVLAYFTLFFRANMAGLQRFKTDALLSITDRFIMIIFALLLMVITPGVVSIWGFITIQTIGFCAAFLLSFYFVMKHSGKLQFKFNYQFTKSLIKKSWPYALLVLLMTLYMRVDYLLIKKLLVNGDIENGIYALANRLFDAANMFAVLISGMLLPIFSKLIQQKNDLTAMLKTALVLLLLPAAIVAILSWFYAPQILSFIKNESIMQSAEVFKWVMISFFFLCMMYVFGTLLTAGANLFTLNKWALIALVINICLNLLFIPKWGAKGAAITGVLTHGFVAITNTWSSFKVYQINALLPFILKVLVVISLCLVVVGACFLFEVNLLFASITVLSVAVLFTFFLRLLQVDWVLNLLKQKDASL